MMSTKLGACALALALAACGPGDGGGGGGSGGNPGSGSMGSGGSGGSTSTAAPRILSLHTNITTMRPSEALVISAVVTDPDGIDDVIGGNLVTPDDAAAYGAFATDASEGAYSISLSWSSLNTIMPISTDAGGSVSRTLRAEFFDVEGNQSWRDVVVDLGCGGSQAACDGTCQAVISESSCGACGHACTGQEQCFVDNTGAPRGCLGEVDSGQRVTCTAVCQATGKSCAFGVANYSNSSSQEIGCTVTPSATDATGATFSGVGCGCLD